MCVLFLRQLAKQVEHLISVAADEHADIIILIRSLARFIYYCDHIDQCCFWPATDSSLPSCPVNNIKRIPMNIINANCPSPHTSKPGKHRLTMDDEDADDTHHLLDNT
ncbi:hypothetical protein T11_4650 [Trichinella zimbabwensis]|uniref:Uncharacterized protein n=1 Tax=Trichinella zimbabwensis TaxID=268475 RepID=A0A0V1H234_9BILA|nr:hypothetical protein T11_4650 [Trichinella zimbabwensis]